MVSIIIPVHKAANSLPRCVDSILAQSYQDWELLLVDDGSPDNSGEICDYYAKKDNRIKVLHKANGGASDARNYGLNYAQGEWISFVDADDFISDNYFESVKNASTDIVILESKRFKGNEFREFTKLPVCKSTDVHSYKDILQAYIKRAIMKVPWGKLIRMERIGDLRFNVGQKIGEDALFMYDLFARCNSIEILNGYVYYWQENSILDEVKYKLTVDRAIEYASLIYRSYLRLDIKSIDLEQFLIKYFFSLCDKEEYKSLNRWFNDSTIQELEQKAFRGALPRKYIHWNKHPYLMLQCLRLMNVLRKIKKILLNGR